MTIHYSPLEEGGGESNEEIFKEKLEKLDELYEEGKDCLHAIYNPDPRHARLYEILREMRDLCVVQMQNIHWKNDN